MKFAALLTVALLLPATAAIADDADDLLEDLDRFAANFLDGVQLRSFAQNVEYCGLFGLDAYGRMVATPAKRGERDSCEPPEAPAAWSEVLASYHTHGAYESPSESPDGTSPDTEVPSIDDLEADIDEGVDGYIATPGGRLWFNDSVEEVAFQLCGTGCLRADPDFRECMGDIPQEEYTLDDLIDRADQPAGDC